MHFYVFLFNTISILVVRCVINSLNGYRFFDCRNKAYIRIPIMYATILAQEISIYVPFIKPCKGVCRTPENRIAPLVSGAVLCECVCSMPPNHLSRTVALYNATRKRAWSRIWHRGRLCSADRIIYISLYEAILRVFC